MASSELSFEAIHDYFLKKGGIVANHEVVKQFKPYLTNSATKDDARIKFKKYINTLATTKIDGEEKFLILRPKYAAHLESPYQDPRNLVGIPISPSSSVQEFPQFSPSNRQPPPYRPPPPPPSTPSPNSSLEASNFSIDLSFPQESITPQAPPRRRSTDKAKFEQKALDWEEVKDTRVSDKASSLESQQCQENEKQPISVKERTKEFNRLASVEDELSPKSQKDRKKQQGKGADEDDGVSVTSLDQKKCAEWLVAAAKGEYQELAKLASDEPRLTKLKDPFTAYTVLHWGAKHGNADIIKSFAGTYKVDVNAKTNGGYTPLHLAAQFGHKSIYNLLIEVYKANPDIRDFSGRKACQYATTQIQSNHIETYSEYPLSKHETPLRTKHQSFLRKNFTPNQRRYKSTIENLANSNPALHPNLYGPYIPS